MKKILLSTIVLFAFSCSIILFQISCKKSAQAATTTNNNSTTGVTQQNKIIYTKNLPLSASGGDYGEIWTANYDGSNAQQINIVLPAGLFISYTPFVRLSPDQKTIFFSVSDAANDNKNTGFYSANVDGTNAKLIVPNDGAIGTIEVAY